MQSPTREGQAKAFTDLEFKAHGPSHEHDQQQEQLGPGQSGCGEEGEEEEKEGAAAARLRILGWHPLGPAVLCLVYISDIDAAARGQLCVLKGFTHHPQITQPYSDAAAEIEGEEDLNLFHSFDLDKCLMFNVYVIHF